MKITSEPKQYESNIVETKLVESVLTETNLILDETKIDGHTSDESKLDGRSSDESKLDGITSDETKTAEPVLDETKTAEPVLDEPKLDNFSLIKNRLTNQDSKQKISACIDILTELYRVLMSTLLILFVPQNCNGQMCTIKENMQFINIQYNSGLVFNFITLFIFTIMYYYESSRENMLINYLDVNKNLPADNESVGKILHLLPNDKKKRILSIDYYYQKIGYLSILFFIINTILSGSIVYKYYLGNQTTTTFITNIIFMITKLTNVYTLVNTEKNIFFSAYLKEALQFNDVDSNKKVINEIELV